MSASNPKHSCLYCEHSCFQRHYIKHILDHHKDILQQKKKLEAKTAFNYKKAISLHSKNSIVFACLGCNKFWARKCLADAHFSSCSNLKTHLDVCRSIFETSQESTEPVVEDNSALVIQLQEQIKKLKRELDLKEFELADSQQKVDAFDTLCACIQNKVNEEERDEWRDWLKSEREDIEWEDYI